MILLELFLTFLKIGAFTFGGGYAMLPLIREAVLENAWISEEAIVDFIAVSESTPGPFAVNMATYVGAEMGGILGSLSATIGVALPSFVIILIVASFYDKFKKSFVIKSLMSGLKPAAVGLIGAAVLSVAATVFFPTGPSFSFLAEPKTYIYLALFAISLFLAFKKKHPILIILLSAAVGIAAGYLL